ncbi:putative transmembrane protein [Senna tora]|uniref:Putative transmembrane protein n=1 Tax=Senna tora TaxID=362788 RepID=A0A834WQE8_9FABA|nr:putative transmembrane protein [Senna tora]
MHSLQWNIQPQMLIEKAIIDCRFFTLFGVVGSLVGSVLCFLEGCFLVMHSYVQYFHILSERLDQGHVVQLLIEAIDMFLVGTAMVMFGVGLYVMFVGSKNYDKEEKDQTRRCAGSNLLGLFSMKGSPRWVGMESIAQAKSKIGHAVMMILQVGILDKFKDIPIVTGFDLACFAAAVLTSSACIFLLSRLHR